MMQLLLVGAFDHVPPGDAVHVAKEMGWRVRRALDCGDALACLQTEEVDAILIAATDRTVAEDPQRSALLRAVEEKRIAGWLCGMEPERRDTPSLIESIPLGISPDELRGRLTMICRYQDLLRNLDGELSNLRRLGRQLSDHFHEVDQEMQLAGRLQRDFLPTLDAPIGNARFASLYLPASWVSGDIFNVFPLDDRRTAFYLADAVGHGMAAGLLTMFINRVLTPTGGGTIEPGEALARLNEALLGQALPNCQFVTAWYGVLDHETLTLTYARGGHPHPFHLSADGITELRSTGGLLGVFDQESFPAVRTRLRPGDRVLLYTDGIELVFPTAQEAAKDVHPLAAFLEPLRGLAVEPLLRELGIRVAEGEGSLKPRDDITMLGLEILDDAPS